VQVSAEIFPRGGWRGVTWVGWIHSRAGLPGRKFPFGAFC
jgi:hypothetical protein